MNKVFIALIVVVIVLAVILSALGAPFMQKMQEAWLGVRSPFLQTGTAVQEQITAMGSGLKSLEQLEEENRRLITENRELKATNQILKDIVAENNKLRLALNYREMSAFKLVPARVIGRDASTWWSTIKINRGFEDGVEVDQPVLTESGLVGKIVTVAKNQAIVVLVTDETCKVAVKIEGTREQGILSGLRVQESGGTGDMQINFLSKMANLQPEQKVYTAGVSNGVFPSGIFVGLVKSFEARPLDGRAIVSPAVDFPSIEDVFVVVGEK